MAKNSTSKNHSPVVKRTCQGGKAPKTSSMNKVHKASHKAYRGQGR